MAVTATTADQIGRIVLDRPPANSYDPDFLEELDAAITSVVDDGAVVAIVSSSSDKFFSAGADVKGFLERSADDNNAMVARAHQIFDRFAAEDTVFVAAIAGHALGGGYEIALACDIRIAAAGTYRIGLPEVTLGLLPGTGGTQRLPRLVGRGRALDMILAGRSVTPDDAYDLGMVDRLVDADDFADTVEEIATTLAGGAPLAIAAAKRAIHDGIDRDLPDGLSIELERMAPLFATDDAIEGMTAFTEKRSATYRGQ